MLWRFVFVHALPLLGAGQQHIGVELNVRALVVSVVLNLGAVCLAFALCLAMLSNDRATKIKWFKRATGSGSDKGN